MTYYAHNNQVFLMETHEVFLTVHHTENCTKTPEDQAQIIAERLNEL